MLIKAAKFGGSSLADARGFLRVRALVAADPARRYIVPSAPGKREDGDRKVTDLLYGLYDALSEGGDTEAALSPIRDRFSDILEGTGAELDLEHELDTIVKNALTEGRDYVAGRGEFLCGKILAGLLRAEFIDARDVIFFDNDGRFDGERTYRSLGEALRRHPYAVVPGFYGSLPNGRIKTFDRGGSDITGAIVARAAHASLYENFTDVPGFMLADPKIIEHPRTVGRMTYREARELACTGASVLHGEAVLPVCEAKIPTRIADTRAPELPGTLVTDSLPTDELPHLAGISSDGGFTMIRLSDGRYLAADLLALLSEHGLRARHTSIGVDGICAAVRTDGLDRVRKALTEAILIGLHPKSLVFADGTALITAVGEGLCGQSGIVGRVLSALEDERVGVILIDCGASDSCITVGVNECDRCRAVRSIYRVLIGEQNRSAAN